MDIVALLEVLVKGLLDAENKFFENPKDFSSLERSVKSSTEAFSASFLGEVLSRMDSMLSDCGARKERFNIQRVDKRTLITSVGDVVFDCTYFKRKSRKGSHSYLLEELIGLDSHERFSEEAEVMLLTEALKTSYREATKVLPSKQRISKTTVMNKIHGLTDSVTLEALSGKKQVDYLFIEADEDHIAEQHGKESKDNKSFISKLIYVHEGKFESGCEGRKELKNSFYFAGLYPGKEGNACLWAKVSDYIEKTYDKENLKKVFISGDGAWWIKNGTEFIEKAVFCADKFHLMKYINQAAAQMLDEKDIAKEELWHLLYSKHSTKASFSKYIDCMAASGRNAERIESLRTYVLENWAAIRRTLRNKLVQGCSAESHVSHVLSDRLSSRPLSWSQKGADKMSKLRCYERNYGREKLLQLVRLGREERKLGATGTEGISVKEIRLRDVLKEHSDASKKYIDGLQASILGETVKKTFSIRNHLRLL